MLTQHYYGGFRTAVLNFSTTNGVAVTVGYDGSLIAAYADIQTTSAEWSAENLPGAWAVQELSQTSYAFWMRMPLFPGSGFFEAQISSTDVFTYSGTLTPSWPPNNSFNPTISNITPAQIGAATTADLALKANAASPTFTGVAQFSQVDVTGSIAFAGNLTGRPNSQLSAYSVKSVSSFNSLSGTLTTTSSPQTSYTVVSG